MQEAYARLRESAVELGDQRLYASHSSIMFSRKACHFFVRPKRQHLELVIFLGRAVKGPQVKKVVESSKTKRAHIIHITHRDQVEAPITEWMREAYELQDSAAARKTPKAKKPKKKTPRRKTA